MARERPGSAPRRRPPRRLDRRSQIRSSTSSTVTSVGRPARIISPSRASVTDKMSRTSRGTAVHRASAASSSSWPEASDAAGTYGDGGALMSIQIQPSSPALPHRDRGDPLSRRRGLCQPVPEQTRAILGCSSVTTSWACSPTSYIPGATVPASQRLPRNQGAELLLCHAHQVVIAVDGED